MIEYPNALLVLEDGTSFKGKAIGKIGKASGELGYNTGMTGYQEALTDPASYGQLAVFTSSHIGNYGVQSSDAESDGIKSAGIIVKSLSQDYSRDTAEGSLKEKLIEDGVVGIEGIDTRALVRYLRSKGAMNAIICSEENCSLADLQEEAKALPSMKGEELASKVSTKEAYHSPSTTGKNHYKVAMLDFGAKRSIIRVLNQRDCEMKVFPMNTPLEEIKSFSPNGIVLSSGPGDPSVMNDSIQLVKEIVASGIPVFGIGLGHQLLALSQGVSVEKMAQGHRGLNHPVINHQTGKGEVTSQNHGFVVSRVSAEDNEEIEITHSNLNDNTIEGIAIKSKPVFSVQYQPESAAGPHDSMYLFDQFIANMDVFKQS